ncbi:hypothetical protein UCRNP2_6084 [Neofusicoccum parvum UCRNP2]|uniref:Uncharacterized protein n=1 Tax=Botryosphaeria parva (strain UCR-NP2) TaxID=1287680 RepID=R1EHB8_BOTPV|nr:hypothetical protein UCRNP2_6084 [Neofusicoccum parvum UCRNP2]
MPLLPTTTTTFATAAARRTLTTTMPYRPRATCPRATRIASVRGLHASPRTRGATKEDHMDREKLSPSSGEYSQTGTDDDVATTTGDAAFNPNKTRPEEEVAAAGRDKGSSQVC